jgi:two-component system chemotaxis response regulator CheB
MIVVGGSSGGMMAMQMLLNALPAGFREPLVVVLHRGNADEDLLSPLLQRGCALTVMEAVDKEPIRAGHVYIAPADYHVLVDRDHLALSVDERVNYARPSVDVLFQSAALTHGARVIAVILTGASSDGARGAREIENRGGRVLVQHPSTAERPDMPRAAIAQTQRPRVLPIAGIASALCQLTERRDGEL